MPTPLPALASAPGPSTAHRRVSERPPAPSGGERDSFSLALEVSRREESVRTTPDADTPRASGNGDPTSKPSGPPAQRPDQGAQEQPPGGATGVAPGGLIVERFPEFPLGEEAPAPLAGGHTSPKAPLVARSSPPGRYRCSRFRRWAPESRANRRRSRPFQVASPIRRLARPLRGRSRRKPVWMLRSSRGWIPRPVPGPVPLTGRARRMPGPAARAAAGRRAPRMTPRGGSRPSAGPCRYRWRSAWRTWPDRL